MVRESPAAPAAINQLVATANRALDVAERIAKIAAASTSGDSVVHVLDRHAWPQLDVARRAIAEFMSSSFPRNSETKRPPARVSDGQAA